MTIRNFVPAAAAFFVLGAAGFFTPTASAQPMWDQVKVHLPYSVTIENKTIPPGNYWIKQLDNPEGNSPVLLVYGKNGMHFKTSALTIPTMDVKTPTKTDVTLQHIGDNYYLYKIWIAGKNYGYEIPLPKNVRERATEAASISVPSEPSSSSETTTTTNTATSESNNQTSTTTAEATPPTPPPPAPATQPAANPPQEEQAPPLAPPPAASADNSANREAQPAPSMPTTSAGWLAMLLSGGTLSGFGMMLRRRKQ
ncbi:MAG TPA: hypothetical protein VMB03_07845 [Bryobacteraceae bacterium]|nr:hypothetical protein [Bryobacteraceae bacterium]